MDLSFNNFHSKSEQLINQEIYVQKTLILLTKWIEQEYVKYNKQKLRHKVNFKNLLKNFVNKILRSLLFDKKLHIGKINRIMKILFKFLIKIIPNRSYIRYRIVPPSKWYPFDKG